MQIKQSKLRSVINAFGFVFVFIYLPHDYNNYKKNAKKKNVGRNGEEV